jgi:hypothetical protein
MWAVAEVTWAAAWAAKEMGSTKLDFCALIQKAVKDERLLQSGIGGGA